MKNLFKFTAVAVALFAFASCSDDVAEFSVNPGFTAANELKIVAEEMDGGNLATRSAYVGTNNARVWQESDEFKVYGPEVIGKYDYYKFSKSSNKFELNGSKDLEEAAFVGFPRYWVNGQNWVKEDGAAYLQFNIPAEMDMYDEVAGSDPTAYVSNLPLWGTAENDGDGIKAKVYFLTAIIKVSLENAAGNATHVRVIAYKNIAGTVPVKINGDSWVQLSENNTVYPVTDVQLPTPTGVATDGVDNYVRMPLGTLAGKSQTSVIYLPLIAGTYGNVKVQYSTDNAATWNDIQVYKNKEFKRGTCYGKNNTHTFQTHVTNVKELNDLLATMTSSTGDLEIKGSVDIAVNSADATVGDNIVIPAMPSVTSLTLDFAAGKMFKRNAATDNLAISGDFAGTLILNAGSDGLADLNIELPNANVVIGQPLTTTVHLTYAKDIQFGGVNKTGDVYDAEDFSAGAITIAEDVADITVFEAATVGALTLKADHMTTELDIQGTAGDIIVNASDLAATTAIKVSGTAGDITTNTATNNATIEVSGTAGDITNAGTGAIAISGVAGDIDNDGTGAITISGKPNYAGTYSKVGDVTTGAAVTINLDNEGAAAASLTFEKATTLALTQGYVGGIIVNSTAATDVVAITLGEEKYNNIGGITLTQGKVSFAAASKWNGEVIGGSIDAAAEQTAAELTAAQAATITAAWEAFANDGTAVYTAIDLAENASAFTLANDIDLNNKAWEPAAATTGDIDGAGFSIKNLTVKVPADGDAAIDGLGLFATLANDVENLTIDGVTIAAVPYKVGAATVTTPVDNIGALAGTITADAEVKYVTIKNIALSTTGGGSFVGGVIGATDGGEPTLTGVTVSGTNTIKGYGNLGGLIGFAADDVTIQKVAKDAIDTDVPAADVASSATASFTANFNSYSSSVTNDMAYLKVGNMIGSADDVTIVITDAASVNPTLTYDKSIYTGTSVYQYISGGNTRSVAIVSDNQSLIGYSGVDATTPDTPATPFTVAPSINGKTYNVYGTKVAAATAAVANGYAYYFYTDAE